MALTLSPKQQAAIRRSTHSINIWDGSVSSGKTIGWIVLLLGEVATAGPVGELVIMGKNIDAIYRNVFKPIADLPLFANAREDVTYTRGAPTARIFGREVHIIGFNDVRSEERIRGGTFQKVFVDEGTLMPEVTWSMLVTRMRAPGPPVNPGSPGIWVTTNPGSQNHYLKTNFLDKPVATDTHRETFLMEDNPTLDPKYIARTKASFTGVFYLRMVLGQWVAAEGAVYEQWDPQTMTVDPRTLVGPQGSAGEGQVRLVEALALGIDYGTQHPTAGELLCLGSDGRMYITHEWAPNPGNKRLTDKQLADRLETFLQQLDEQGLRPRFIYADPAGASFREELHQRGINTTRADNDVISGIATVDAALTAGDLKVSTACRRLVDEIPSYRWDEKAAERGVDKPIKEEDDYVDGFRYAVFSSRHLWRRHVG